MYENTNEWQKIDLEKIKQQYRDMHAEQEAEILRNYAKIIADVKSIESSAEYAQLMSMTEDEYNKAYHYEQNSSLEVVRQKLSSFKQLHTFVYTRTYNTPYISGLMFNKETLKDTIKDIAEKISAFENTKFGKTYYEDKNTAPVFVDGKVNEDFVKIMPDRMFDKFYTLSNIEKRFMNKAEPSTEDYKNLSGSDQQILKFISLMEGGRIEEKFYTYSRGSGSHTHYDYHSLDEETVAMLKSRVQKLAYLNMQQQKEQEVKKQGGKLGDDLGGLFNVQSEKGKEMLGSQKGTE